MSKHDRSVRVRFAPSPTGHLHIGGLRAAIFNWLFARHMQGKFLLRIEDTDRERSEQKYTDSILASFAWMHITWDEPYVIQSERIARHQEIAQHLYAHGKAYYCTCTHDAIVERLSAMSGFDPQFIKYDGHCRTAGNTAGALRFLLPSGISSVAWDDLIHGTITVAMDQLDDFIIVRSDGTPMYNFVVVVDDADMRISHVIRGQEHIANTPKQILLYQACEFSLPFFAHLPLILGPDGSKLSKRDAATGVIEYKEQGYLPDALFNYLVRLGWAHKDQEVFTKQELIDLFSLEQVGKKGAVFDKEKLDWLNGVYLRGMPDQDILTIVLRDICPTLLSDLPEWHSSTVLLLINMYKQRVATLQELVAEIKKLYKQPTHFEHHDIERWITAAIPGHLEQISVQLHQIADFTADQVSEFLKKWVANQNSKMVVIAQPLRIALVGKSSGPGVVELMAALGKHETIRRINSLVEYIKHGEQQ